MKVVWEIEDIKSGRVVGKPDVNERFMIGWRTALHGPNTVHMISLLDGMVLHDTAQEVCDHLNNGGWQPIELQRDFTRANSVLP